VRYSSLRPSQRSPRSWVDRSPKGGTPCFST
jgi:hypothetical protein